jgi:hypothetical protein
VSFTDLLPIRIGFLDRTPRRPKHSAPAEVDRLRGLLDGAHALIKGLHLQMTDLEKQHAEVVARIDERHGEIVRGLENQIADLERRLDVRVLAESVVTKTQELSLEEIRKHCVIPLHEAPFATTDPGRIGEGVA